MPEVRPAVGCLVISYERHPCVLSSPQSAMCCLTWIVDSWHCKVPTPLWSAGMLSWSDKYPKHKK